MTTAKRTAEQIIEAYDHEARHILRTTHIDLDAFLALGSEQRAARWRTLDAGDKQQLVAQAIVRQTGRDWTVEEVEACVAHWDGKYGAAPLATEAAVAGAMEREAERAAQSARQARQDGRKDEATYFQRQATAYTHALEQWLKGVRPTYLQNGAWLLPSRRAGEAAHIVRMDGDWVCSCKAGHSMHWPIAMVIGQEMGADALNDTEAGDWDEAPEPTPAALGKRLAAARACYQVAA